MTAEITLANFQIITRGKNRRFIEVPNPVGILHTKKKKKDNDKLSYRDNYSPHRDKEITLHMVVFKLSFKKWSFSLSTKVNF